MRYQRAQRPAAYPSVVSIAELALFALPDDPIRSTEEVVEAVRRDWPLEVTEVEQEAGNGASFVFADGSNAHFSAWR